MMNQRLARKILDEMEVIQEDQSLYANAIEGMSNIDWPKGSDEVWLCDNFTADQLEAIAWWMRKH